MSKNNIRKKINEWVYLTVGVAIAAFAFSFFLNPKNIVIGGVSGIGIILKVLISGYDPAITILVLNILLLFLGLFLLGKDFFIKTAYGSLIFPLFIALFDWIYVLLKIDITTLDMILIVFFAALIMGIGLGMVVKKGGTTGGTEVLQKIIFKYLHIPYSKSLYILDGIVIFTGFLLGVNDLQTFLYAIIFTYLSGVAVDAVVFSGFNKRAVYIISDQLDAIREEILHNHERGLTSAKVIGEYSKNERTMLICVLSSNEYFKLRDFVEKVDPKAFLYAVRASEVRGEGFTYD